MEAILICQQGMIVAFQGTIKGCIQAMENIAYRLMHDTSMTYNVVRESHLVMKAYMPSLIGPDFLAWHWEVIPLGDIPIANDDYPALSPGCFS